MFEEIYKLKDFQSLIENGVITKSFFVESTVINKMIGVKEIRTGFDGTAYFKNLVDLGDLEYVDCNFEFSGNLHSLKKLKYVGGEFRFDAPILSLGLLKEVGGDLRPKSNELCDLGALEVVGGTLDLRGMVNIKNLGNLKYVGENLNLVKSLKSSYDLSNITVKGKISYWNKEPKYFKSSTKTISKIKIPSWENRGRYEFENNLINPNKWQQKFYTIFKENFENGKFIDVGGMRNYIRYYIYSILRNYHLTKDFNYLCKTFDTLRKEYPDLSRDTNKIEIEIGRELKIEKYLNVVLPHEELEVWVKFLKSKIKQIKHINGSLSMYSDNKGLLELFKIGFKNQNLTKFGKENLETILERVIIIIRKIEDESKEALPRRFFDKGKYYKSLNSSNHFDPLYYEMFFESQIQFNEINANHKEYNYGLNEKKLLYPNYYPSIVLLAIENYMKEITREAENQIRVQRCLPKIGEGWISETNLFYEIKIVFPKYLVVHHGKTKWLGYQHFDIYFPEINVAIEYQGRQHTEIVEYFGGDEGYNQRLKNDSLKKEKCKTNNCILIEVFPDYNFENVKSEIENAIKMKSSL